jgi:hypothetical protein
VIRAYAKRSFILPFDKLRMYGSLGLNVFCMLFFTARGEKEHTEEKIRGMRTSY